MMRQKLRPWISCTMLTLLIPSWLLAQPVPRSLPDTPASRQAETPKKLRGRLPAYCGKLVDDSQRQDIYQIQARYRDRIQKLQTALADLTRARDQEILSVLTPDQQEQLEALRKAARERTRKTRENPASDTEPATPRRRPASR